MSVTKFEKEYYFKRKLPKINATIMRSIKISVTGHKIFQQYIIWQNQWEANWSHKSSDSFQLLEYQIFRGDIDNPQQVSIEQFFQFKTAIMQTPFKQDRSEYI